MLSKSRTVNYPFPSNNYPKDNSAFLQQKKAGAFPLRLKVTYEDPTSRR